MDVLRVGVVEQKKRRRLWISAVVVFAVVIVVFLVSRLEPAAPSVDRDTVWLGTVELGSMLRQVRGNGTLVPEEVRHIPARTWGRVEQILADPGARVEADTVLLVLSNPEVEQQAIDAQSALRRAEAEFESLHVDLMSRELDHRADAAAVDAEYLQARLRAEADGELSDRGLISHIDLEISRSVSGALATRCDIERQRLEMTVRANRARLQAKEAEVAQQRAMNDLRQEQLHSLQVRPGLAGVVQEIAVEIGQQVEPGGSLARVAEPTRLKAELRVPATQARDVQVGQAAIIDTRNGTVPGIVVRIDPAVREGTVLVEVRLDGALPRGARPDLNVDGTIEIEHLEDVLFVGRPAFGQEGATVGLFRLLEDGNHATRATVKLGRSSVSTIEVIEGLKAGDQVILSDTSRWDDHDRIRLR